MSNNLDFLRTAVFMNKDSNTDEDGNVEVLASKDFNQMFLDPYKSMIINEAGRVKMTMDMSEDENGNLIEEKKYFTKGDYIREYEAYNEAVKSYVIMNVKDALLSIGSSFVDALAGQFVYDVVPQEEHYEFEFPYSLLTKNDKDIVEDAYNEIFYGNLLSPFKLYEDDDQVVDINISTQHRVGVQFDKLYSVLVRKYFDTIVTKTACYYINKPAILPDFYKGFFDKTLTPFEKNGYNNLYGYVSIALREMMQPYIENFKDAMYIMANTVSSMLIAYTANIDNMSYDEYMRTNPFAYEILIEKYGKEEDNEEENEDE